MSKKFKIYLADLSHDYLTSNFTVPLGVGFVAEYLEALYPKKLEIRLFKSPEKLLKALKGDTSPHILGLSNYSWNEGINRLVEKTITRNSPETVLVSGGPHIRTDDAGIRDYLNDHPVIDYYVMFEGEWPMGFLVGMMLDRGSTLKPTDLDGTIPGVAFLKDEKLFYEPYSSKKGDLDNIPSPYLSGRLDEFLADDAYQPLLETNRGCPFACTFCAWGISALNKVRRFQTDRLIKEIDYISSRTNSTYWQFTDANFGMYERDIEIAKAIKDASQKCSLDKIGINWAKNSSKFCTEIAYILKGIADPLAAVQSTDPEVLKIIKRDNIKMSTMTDLLEQSRIDGIPMTTDVLSGLPGESYSSHLDTLRTVFDMGFDYFNVGPIRMLPGSEMESEQSRKEYGLKTQYRLISGNYGKYDGNPVVEYEESVVASSDMTREETYKLRLIHFFTWVFWNSGLGQPLLRWLHAAKDINPLDAILSLVSKTDNRTLTKLVDDYMLEARSEWFESREELLKFWEKNFDKLVGEDYVKLNLKYLAKIILDKGLATDLLGIMACQTNDPIAKELADFSIDRIFFLEDRNLKKTKIYSDELVAQLSLIYPNIKKGSHPTCVFSLDKKRLTSFEHELGRYGFEEKPERAMAQFLQIYGTDLLYDFAFGGQTEISKSRQAIDSFDYDKQIYKSIA
jgi:radical SAM superfamily enzyme YgiQ (UPF0313 family)